MVAQFSPDTISPRAMLEGAERTAQLFDVTREELDPWAVRSHARAAAARPVVAPFYRPPYSVFVKMKASGLTFPKNWHAACRHSLRKKKRGTFWGDAAPIRKIVPTLTAATSCLTHDGAAFVVLASQRKVADLGPHVKPLARIIGAADVGVDPRLSPLGTLKVGEKLLQQAGLHFSDMDSIEYNEAFAVISALFARQHPEALDAYLPLGGALS